MLEWFASFVHDPACDGRAHRVPGITAPVYLVVTPVPSVFLKFLCAWQFFTIRLIEFGNLP